MLNQDPKGKSQSSRREFLKMSAAVAGAGALGSLAMGRAVHAAGSDVLRIGLVGCGGRGSGAAVNAMNVSSNNKLVAMADAFADRLERSLEQLQKAKPEQVAVDADHRFAGFDACQKLLASDVDVVLLATPPHFRPMHLKACVEAGKHVFAEKPVAVDAPGVRAVLAACEAARQKNLSIVSGLCWRYDNGVRETIARVHGGQIGRIVAIRTTYNCGPPWFRNVARQPGQTEMDYQMRNWYPFTWLSGDHNVEQHVHSLDKAAWALGDRPPARAWGMGGRQVRTEEAIGNIFDHHAVVYQFDDDVEVYSYCRRQAGCYNETSDYILGTKGRCNVLKYRIEGEKPWRYEGPKNNKYDDEHAALFQSIRQNKPINDGAFMTLSTMWAILGRMVTYTGQQITWQEAIDSSETLAPQRYDWDAAPPVLPDKDGKYPFAVPGITRFS